MFPWLWLNLITRYPWSGDVSQDIEPHTYWDLPFSGDYVGNRRLERQILARGAGYGQQLGAILDALDALIRKDGRTDVKAFEEVQALRERIDTLKRDYRGEAERHARDALDSLKEADPAAHDRLIREIAKKAES
ncbi:MAG: hypothetical protein QNJ94_00970 [Alphaproteobacteria bacterium]|nr:hypothetical protein [Alphaproteobacteria bacterium]